MPPTVVAHKSSSQSSPALHRFLCDSVVLVLRGIHCSISSTGVGEAWAIIAEPLRSLADRQDVELLHLEFMRWDTLVTDRLQVETRRDHPQNQLSTILFISSPLLYHQPDREKISPQSFMLN